MPRLLLLLAFSPCLAYDQGVGLQLAYLEKAVYCGEENFTSWNVGSTLTKGPKVDTSKLRFLKSAEQAAAGVGRLQPSGCFVAIRGTYGPISSLLDAAFWLMDFDHDLCPSCQVVAGFYVAYLSLRDQIFAALQDFDCQGQALHLVGHSQGAASLTYFLFDALRSNFTVQHMYALESPRPGNAAFGEAVRALLGTVDAWRVAHYQDIVVHLPPPGPYQHALPEIYYKARKGTEFLTCGVEDSKCSNRWWPWQWKTADHEWYADIDPCRCGLQDIEETAKVPVVAPLFT
ncbi:unnamed protein product [Effrenium voratum]|nr:unnamed protein product [Effrenium voratum]CAJ1437236.1 unnamed protein product [Effrenium voratum]